MVGRITSFTLLLLYLGIEISATIIDNGNENNSLRQLAPEQQFTVPQQLCGPYQLLSQYSFGATSECPDKLKMDVQLGPSGSNRTLEVPYERIKIDLGSWYSARQGRGDNNFTGVQCKGPKPNTALTLQSGAMVLTEEFERTHNLSASTRMLLKSIAPHLESGVFWFSRPRVAPFNCSKHNGWFGEPWFRDQFTFIFFNDNQTVPISFIGKKRYDGSSRIVTLDMTGGIRYFIATAPQSTCIYRSVLDAMYGKGPIMMPLASPAVLPPTEQTCEWVCDSAVIPGLSTVTPIASTNMSVPSTPVNQKRKVKRSRRFAWSWCDAVNDTAPRERKSGKRACFPGAAQVMLRNGRHVRMDSLRTGDDVLVSGGKYSRVVMFTHALNDKKLRSFIALTTASGRMLTLSAGHLVPVRKRYKAKHVLVRADVVHIGDELINALGDSDIVIHVDYIRAHGLFNPHTNAGTIVVDGMLASCYTSEIAPAVAHSALAPLRSLLAATSITVPRTMCAEGCPALLGLWRIFEQSKR